MKSLRFVVGSVVAVGVCIVLIAYRPEVGDSLRGARSVVERLFYSERFSGELESLRAENQRLSGEISLLQQFSRAPSVDARDLRVARVYSRYPLNDRERLVVDRGTSHGVSPGAPVFVTEGVLAGVVVSVDRERAEVQTIFDPGWKSSVVVGSSSIKAVLTGGIVPRLSLISPTVPIAVGEPVLNVAPEFPFGVLVGTVAAPSEKTPDGWQVAPVTPLFRSEALEWVLVATRSTSTVP